VAESNPEQKLCSGCRVVKPVEEFNFKYRAKGIRHSYCRECGKRLTRSHYKRNKQSYLDRNTRAYQRHRELIRQMKSRPCADCGIQYPYYIMDFDHRDGEEKLFELNSVARMTTLGIAREIQKCDVVCANCHRERTHQRLLVVLGVKSQKALKNFSRG
jgi:hypothetical protein